MSTALHILADHHNVVGWWLVLNYMRTPPIHYYLDCSGQAAYMETHPYTTLEEWQLSHGGPTSTHDLIAISAA